VFALLGARGRFAWPVAGALAGLATLTRYNAVALLPAGLVYLAWRGEAGGASRKRAAAFFLTGFALVAGPWLVYSLSQGQVPGATLVRNFAFYSSHEGTPNIQDWPGDFTGEIPTTSLGDLLRSNAGSLAIGVLRAIPDHLVGDAGVLLGWPAAALCFLGLAFLVLERRLRPLAALWIPGAALFLALVPVFYSARYSLPLAPFYLSLAGAAVASPRFALTAPRAGVPLKWLVALLAIGFTLQWNVAQQKSLAREAPVEVIEAGRALRAAAAPGERVVSRKGHIGYYSGLGVTPFPRLQTLGELAEHCRKNGAQFLYYSWLEVQLRPEFAFLLDTASAVRGLSVVHVTEHHPSVVYRIGADFGRDPAWLGDANQRRLRSARAMARTLPDSLAWPHWNLLAAYALDQRRPEEALEHAARATRGEPRDTLGWALEGEALRELGRLAEAREAYGRALALDPGELQSRIGLGWVELGLGRPEEAARLWRPAIAETRDDATLRAMQALFEKLGDLEAAQEAANARGRR
jgi:hypothetical protein